VKIAHKILIKISAVLLLLISVSALLSQRLNIDTKISFTLQDKTEVTLYAAHEFQGESLFYYYLPVNLRISVRNESTPEFSFLTYKEEEGKEISGGILHWLLKWGLTAEQENEVQRLLKSEIDSNLVMMGAAAVSQLENDSCFQILSDNPVASVLRRSMKSVGSTPLLPGGKLAVSFMFNAEDARTIKQAFENTDELEGIKIVLNFKLPEMYGSGKINIENVYKLKGDLQQWIKNL